MTEFVDLMKFAVSNGFWAFVGIAILLSILADGCSRWITFLTSQIRNATR